MDSSKMDSPPIITRGNGKIIRNTGMEPKLLSMGVILKDLMASSKMMNEWVEGLSISLTEAGSKGYGRATRNSRESFMIEKIQIFKDTMKEVV